MGQFQPGQSGNPAGRPKGSKDYRTELRALFQPHAPELIAKAVELARGGDVAALRICIDRIIPPAKARGNPVAFDLIGESVTELSQSAIRAMAAGEISPDEAAEVLQAFAAHVKIMEADELDKRIAALEAKSQPAAS